MKKLVFFPNDPIQKYVDMGQSYRWLRDYYNPAGYFDEVYCLSPFGKKGEEYIDGIHYIRAYSWEFKKYIKDIKPDIVRGYGGTRPADWVSVSKVKGVHYVTSIHNTNKESLYPSIAYADSVICMSEAVKEAVMKRVPLDPGDVYVLPNRVDTDFFSKKHDPEFFRKLDERFGEGRHVLHLGRKAHQKNIETLIRAVALLDKDVKCITAGKGNTKEYEAIARECGVSDRCFLLQNAPYEELPLWYSWADCFALPSRHEGFSFVCIEAAACESVIVTSDIGPMNEFLEDGKNAILIQDHESPEDVAACIKRALDGGPEIEKLRKGAREVGLCYGKDRVDAAEIAIYEEVLKKEPGNRFNYGLLPKMALKDAWFTYKNLKN